MKKLYFLFFMLLIASVSFSQVIITEIADPNNDALLDMLRFTMLELRDLT